MRQGWQITDLVGGIQVHFLHEIMNGAIAWQDAHAARRRLPHFLLRLSQLVTARLAERAAAGAVLYGCAYSGSRLFQLNGHPLCEGAWRGCWLG